MHLTRLATVALACSCGRIDFDPLGSEDLRLRVHTYDFDGTRSHAYTTDTWRDDEQCFAQQWSDGIVRCTPLAYSAVYRDAACSQPLGSTLTASMQYVSESTRAEPVLVDRVWKSGAITPVTSYYRLDFDKCEGPYTSSGATFYELEAVDPSELAQLRVTEDTASPRLVQRYVEEPGGPRVRWGVEDRQLGTSCTFTLLGTNITTITTIGCIPSNIEYNNEVQFEDAACTQLASDFYRERPPSYFALDLDACNETPETVHPNLGISPSSVLYELSPSCTPTGGSSGRIYTVGPALDIAILTRRIESTGRRIEQRLFENVGFVTQLGLYDTQLSAPCIPAATADGYECRPQAALTFELFTDAACTLSKHLYVAETCAPSALPGLVHVGPQLHELGGQYTSPVYRQQSGCTEVTGAAFYEPGPVATPVLARGQLVTLP